jgi:glycosyltransferase involved in cell wall biosynthesis
MTGIAPSSFRVVHAAENIKGGVGTYLRDLVVAQRAAFGDGAVVAVVPRSQSDILESPAGVELITFDDRGPRWRSTLRLAARMRAVMARLHAGGLAADAHCDSVDAPSRRGRAPLLAGVASPLIVHLHSTFAGLALRPLLRWAPPRRWARTPREALTLREMPIRQSCAPVVVYCAHGWSFDRETSAVSKQLAMTLERALAPLCDAVVCISEHEMRIAREARIAPRMMAHVANGIPMHPPVAAVMSRPDWPADKRRLLFVGRFDRQKGVDILIDALRELRDSTFAYLVGSAVLNDGATLNLPDNVRATGWLSAADLTAYYETADVLVAPSRWEGFGLTAVEAMRAGLPVIATRVGGLAEVVEHGATGLLVEPNSSAALASAIRSLGTESLQSMGEAGRRRFIERFTLDRMHSQLTGLYQRLSAQRAAMYERAPSSARAQPEGSPNA